MRTRHTHPLILAVVLVALTGPAAAPDNEPADFLPLAVGNSWTFLHWVGDPYAGVFPSAEGQFGYEDTVTITVERTEVIGDTTYYVLSDVPAGFLAPPPHCPVGKKLRWKGSELMERTDTGERSFFRFEGPPIYTIPLTHGDDEVVRRAIPSDPARVMGFTFRGHDAWDWVSEHEGEADWYSNRLVNFQAGYGLLSCHEWLQGPDYPVYDHVFGSTHAVLVEASGGGASGQSGTTRTVRSEDALKQSPAVVAPSSWGKLKGSAR